MLKPGAVRIVRGMWLPSCAALLVSGGARADSMRVNGVTLEVRHLTVAGAPLPAATRLMRRWQASASGSPVTLTSANGAVVVGRLRGPLHEAVLFRAGASSARSDATVSVSHSALTGRALPSLPFVLPWPAQTLSAVESGQGAAASTQFVVLVGARIAQRDAAQQAALQAAIQRNRWVVQSREPWRATRGSESLLIVVHSLPRGAALVIDQRHGVGR